MSATRQDTPPRGTCNLDKSWDRCLWKFALAPSWRTITTSTIENDTGSQVSRTGILFLVSDFMVSGVLFAQWILICYYLSSYNIQLARGTLSGTPLEHWLINHIDRSTCPKNSNDNLGVEL